MTAMGVRRGKAVHFQHDFYGFPQPLYELRYPALGAAGANARIVRELKNETDRALSLDSYVLAATAT